MAFQQGANKVNVDRVEPASWGWKLSWRRLEMVGSLHKMTLMAVVYHGLHYV